MKFLIPLLACIFLTGCAPNSAIKKTQPINLDPKQGSYAGVATEANQRLVLSALKSKKAIEFYRAGVFALCQAAISSRFEASSTSEDYQKNCTTASKNETPTLKKQPQILGKLGIAKELDSYTEFEIQMFQFREAVEKIMLNDVKKAEAEAKKAGHEAEKIKFQIELEKLKEKNKASAKGG